MTTRNHTHADFNTPIRQIICRLDIYFDESNPMSITDADYLLDLNISEDCSSDDTTPLGKIVANTLDFSLHSPSGRFDPSNTASPYYGKIKKGIKVIPYFKIGKGVYVDGYNNVIVRRILEGVSDMYKSVDIRYVEPDDADALNWIQMGTYYVRDWTSKVTQRSVDVYCTDIMEDILCTDSTKIPVSIDVSFTSYINTCFNTIGYQANIDNTLTQNIKCASAGATPGDFLTELVSGAFAFCSCNHSGIPQVKKLKKSSASAITFTDNDQLISINTTMALSRTAPGVAVTYRLPQVKTGSELLKAEQFKVPTGTTTFTGLQLTTTPALKITSVVTENLNGAIIPRRVKNTPWTVDLTLENPNEDTAECTLKVIGESLGFSDVKIDDQVEDSAQYSNQYIQDAQYAESFSKLLRQYVKTELPKLNITIRDDLLINIGDTVIVQSDKFGVNFSGIVQKIQHKYTGSLSAEMELLNTQMWED